MLSKVVEVLRVPELRNKVMFTLGMLLVYRLGFAIYLPGVDVQNVEALLGSQGNVGAAFGILNALSGSALSSCTVFSLGVMPYISASIIFSLLTKMVPSLEQLSKEGAQGQKKINQWTRYATVPICLFQAMFIVRGLLGQNVTGSNPIIPPDTFNSFFYQVAVMLILTTGTLFIMWVGEKITEHGIGNGVSLIIMAGILARVPALMLSSLNAGEGAQTQTLGMLIGIFLIVVMVIVYFTKAQRRIPIQQAKLTRGRRQVGGARHYIPLKVNAAGVMPIIFASALFIIPNLLSQVPGLRFLQDYFGYNSYFYILAYTSLIFFFAFFWTALMFQPTRDGEQPERGRQLYSGDPAGQAHGGLPRADVMVRVDDLAGAAFLAAIALVSPVRGRPACSPTFRSGLISVIGGTSILIVVGVCLDLVDKINAHLVMRNYDGFMTGAKSGGSSSWARGRKS